MQSDLLTCAVCVHLSDVQPHRAAFLDWCVDQTGPVISTVVPSDAGDVPEDSVIFRVHDKDASPIALCVLGNLFGLCYILMDHKMAVNLYTDVRRKGEFKGDVGAEEPGDIRVTLDCVETKEVEL